MDIEESAGGASVEFTAVDLEIKESEGSTGVESAASHSGQLVPVVAHATGETVTMQAETLNSPKTVTMATQSAVPVRSKETVAIAVAASNDQARSEDKAIIATLRLQLDTSKRNVKAMAKERDEKEAQSNQDKENESNAECTLVSAACKRKEVSLLPLQRRVLSIGIADSMFLLCLLC